MDANKVLLIALTVIVHASSLNALKCYQCSVSANSTCSTTIDCQPNEACNLRSVKLSNGNSFYRSGCKDKALCSGGVIPSIIGRRHIDSPRTGRRSITTDQCCSVDNCNGPPGTVTTPAPTPTTGKNPNENCLHNDWFVLG